MTWVGTMNINRGGVSKNQAISAFLHDFPCDVLGLQEVNINQESAVSYVEQWRRLGFSCLLSAFDDGVNVYRLALLSAQPLKQLVIPNISAAGRYCAGILDVDLGQGHIEKLVVCSLYGHCGDSRAAGDLCNELVRESSSLDTRWILLGDFNMVQADSALASLLCSGAAYCLDDPFGADNLPGTCGANRRIDFGIGSCRPPLFCSCGSGSFARHW